MMNFQRQLKLQVVIAKLILTNQASPSGESLENPEEGEVSAEEDPAPATQDDVVTDISALEDMVSDITNELKGSKDDN